MGTVRQARKSCRVGLNEEYQRLGTENAVNALHEMQSLDECADILSSFLS